MVEVYNPDMQLRVQLYKVGSQISIFKTNKTAQTYLFYGTANVHHKLAIFKSPSKFSQHPLKKVDCQFQTIRHK